MIRRQECVVERRLAAILCADVYGYSRLMGEDEEATILTLSAHRKIIDGLIEQHHGRFVNSAGDSVLAEFASVVHAVQCGVEIQSALKTENGKLPTERRMQFRIGINLGDVMVQGDQIYGDGVNVAARLESLADPGGICVSRTVHDQTKNKLSLNFEDFGDQHVKNITEPIRVFRVLPDGAIPSVHRKTQRVPRNYWRGGLFSLAGLTIILVTVVLVQHISLKPPHSNASIPPTQSQPPLPDKPSIAVLPFVNMSGDRDQEYFSDGITDDLITDLSRLPGLFVIARESTFTYKGKIIKLQDVGKELGVKYVLGGSVRKAASQIRITVQLADATTGHELWAESYDRALRDVFALQNEIVRRIITTLNLELALSQQGYLIPRTTENLEAYDDLLRGTEFVLSLTKVGNAKARPLLEKAIELDSKYAAAYAFLGYNYFAGFIFALDIDPTGIERAVKMEQRAIALDDSLPVAHSAMAEIDTANEEYDEAGAEAQRAIALDPNSAPAYQTLADVLDIHGEPAEALVAAERAMRLDPRNADKYMFEQGVAYGQLGRWKESILVLKRHLARYPYNFYANAWLANDYSFLGEDGGARTEAAKVDKAVALTPNSAPSYMALALTLDSLGKPSEALAAIDTSIRLDPQKSNFCVCHLRFRGFAHTLLGRWREAIADFKPYVARYPDDAWAHAYLAVDYIELKQDGPARAEVARALELNPQFTVDTIFPTAGLQHGADPAEIDRYRADLHKAGMS
jgi:adenylate cyclase